MPNRRIYVRTLERALRIVGSEQVLADLLWVARAELRRYLSGEVKPTTDVFLKTVDIVFNNTWASHASARTRENLQATATILKQAERSLADAAAICAQAESVLQASRASARAHRLFDPAYRPADREELLDAGLDAALAVAGTDTGDIELADANGVLRMVTWRGFPEERLEALDCISEQPSACRAAFAERRQVVVGDLAAHPFYGATAALAILQAANVRAVCATPLVTVAGDALGIVAIHCHQPKAFQREELAALEEVARGTAGWLSRLASA